MKTASLNPQLRERCHDLVNVCDELLASCGGLRKAAEATGRPWPNNEAARVIDRVLDARIQLYRALDLPLPKP
jgi:hypothetical protein